MFGHLEINRAIATRYDQLANSFLGMVHLATARYWLKSVPTRLSLHHIGRERLGSSPDWCSPT